MLNFIKKYKIDIIIISSLFLISLIVFLSLLLTSKKDNLIADIKKENQTILKIDLSKENEPRRIDLSEIDENIKMELEVKKDAIRVSKSECPSQYCVNQGFATNSSQTIICAHFKVVISLGSNGEIII